VAHGEAILRLLSALLEQPAAAACAALYRHADGATAMKKWRIVRLGFGTARQKRVLE
jgi:hypothetical protein